MAEFVVITDANDNDKNISAPEVTTLNGGSVTTQQANRVILALRTGSLTAIDLPGDATNGLDVDVTRWPSSSSATVVSVGDESSNVTLANSNASRKRIILHNRSSARCYVKLGVTASATDYSFFLDQYEDREIQQYTGRIDGFFASDAGGAMLVTEW